MNSTTPAHELFTKATKEIAAAVNDEIIGLAGTICEERQEIAKRLLRDVDDHWRLHRDQNGPLPQSQINEWREVWLDIARRCKAVVGEKP